MSDLISLDTDWLDTPEEIPEGFFPWQEIYPGLSRKPLRLSYSTFNTLHSCERKFQLLKLKNINDYDVELELDSRENNVNLDYGSAFGIGIQEYLISGDIEKAIWEAIRSYNYAEETEAKNVLGLVAGIQAFKANWNFDEWEVAQYNGKPAVELSFKIILNEETQDYYCGYKDLVLIHKPTNIAAVAEVKTTGLKLERIDPLYRNSGQALGYSVTLDKILECSKQKSAWTVLYIVNQLRNKNILPKIHILPFEKSVKDKLSWLLDLRLDYEHLCRLLEIDHWPMRGNACLAWNRTCPLYGICDLNTTAQARESLIKPEEDWDFIFTLDELIQGII